MTGRTEQEPSLAASYDGVGQDLAVGSPGCPTCGQPSLRVGTDVQGIDSVAEAIAAHGERYLSRVYTAQEVEDCRSGGEEWTSAGVSSLAARYAAKEAVIKVLRPVQTGVVWTEIEVVRQPGGWCTMVLRDDANRLADESGLTSWAVSIAHDETVAVATVIARHDCAPEGRS